MTGRMRQRGDRPVAAVPERLTAPYAFVPLNELVFEPGWADRISHEVPFSDAVTGTIAFEIEALTPMLLGAEKKDSGDPGVPATKTTYAFAGRSAIPGASLKGTIRSIVEATSFGRMGERMDDRRFSIRDLRNPRDYIAHMTEGYGPRTRAGWLTLDPATGGWLLQPCDYSVVRQIDLEHHAREAHRRTVQLGRRGPMMDKYRNWGGLPLEIRFDPDEWRARDDWAKGRRLSRADNVGRGSVTGTIVFTGQPQDRTTERPPRKGESRKKVDFIFHREIGEPVPVPPAVREDFEAIHRDPNTRKPNAEWEYWRARLLEPGSRVPVFWLPRDGEGGEGPIRAIGLAMMFRLAYRHSTRDLARQRPLGGGPDAWYREPEKAGFDLADCLFGRVVPKAGRSLRGRVRFSHALLEKPGNPADEREVEAALLAPKPGFYPAYVAQPRIEGPADRPRVRTATAPEVGWKEGFPDYATYQEDGRIRGRKRYPASRTVRKSPTPEPYSAKVMTRFTPVGRGAVFRGRISIDGLRSAMARAGGAAVCEELGALVWALTWGGRTQTHAHSFGGAKPYGYGAARLRLLEEGTELEFVRTGERVAGAEALKALGTAAKHFEEMMTVRLKDAGIDWAESGTIRELLATADLSLGDNAAAGGRLDYLVGPKPFQQVKGRGLQLVLPNHSGDALPAVPAAAPAGPAATRPVPGRPGQRPAAPSKPARRWLLDGEPVEEVSRTGGEVTVRFLDSGDIETVRADELEEE